jgi:hypothetical protein
MYFNFTSLGQTNLNLEPHVVQEGTLFRLVGAKGSPDMDTSMSYEALIRKANYDNLLDPDIYFNYEDFDLRIINPLKQSFNALATSLYKEGSEAKANAVLSHALKYFYQKRFKASYSNLQTGHLLMLLKRYEEAAALVTALESECQDAVNNGTATAVDEQLMLYAKELLAEIRTKSASTDLAQDTNHQNLN